MKPPRSLFLLISALFLALPSGARANDDAESVLSRLEKKYSSIHDATITFVQHVQFGVSKVEQTFNGKLFMKKGNKYRIELEQQTIVTDGKSVWSYNKMNNQVLIDKYKDDPRSFSPDKVLVDIAGTYWTTMLGKEKVEDRELTVLKLVPKSSKSNITWMKVWVDTDNWLMRKIQVLDISENLTTYSVRDISLNTGLTDDAFQFTPPSGTDVIDLR